ncbi:uncharacterized protein B0J16DRAFT_417588 [Fusarium flagelliforme]|uniref:uncharacterized protein n=1 Tax=Fusarium flagelliforme TaxID=2675880 RepID=UPI001E8EBDB7|nr:uncharacterized protein B0J16DRAFT_417588 [Fusarium flagelliforme]KAH7179984.1 hypothetical protein B0J16DRAFT_417588 [Fusarium flagelliforme]
MTRRSKLKSWIQGKLGKGRSDPVIPEPPMLTEPRHVLTPTSSSDDLRSSNQTASIFTRIPPEIRHEILLQAFGGRTVHIDLVYQHPLNMTRQRNPGIHYGENTQQARGFDMDKPECWQWRGCVCHRKPSNVTRMFGQIQAGILDPSGGPTGNVWPPLYPEDPSSGLGEDMDRYWFLEEPGEDGCCKGYAHRCGAHIDPSVNGRPDSCWIGAMGWLLACRKAYTEGIEVLYGTNTIHMGSKPLLQNLPRLIPSQRLQTMNALEIVWKPDMYIPPGGRRGYANIEWRLRLEQIPQVHDIILQTFPHVRRLHLAFAICSTTSNKPDLNDMVLQWDEFATALLKKGNLQAPLTISLTQDHWNVLYEKAKQDALNKDCTPVLDCQFWRWTNGKCALAPLTKSTETWVKIDNATKENGYWVVRGEDDDREARQARLQVCFGSS